MAPKLITNYLYTLFAITQIIHLFPGRVVLILPVTATTFTLTNNCEQTVWPGILSNAGVSPLPTTGFSLHTGESKSITPPSNWGGRFWGRTHCTTTTTTQLFTCLTGDCGSGTINCSSGAKPPATLAEFTLDGSGGQDFYDVSLVDGYNLPILVVPRGGSGDNCTSTGCVSDLNGSCPSDLRVMEEEKESGSVVACTSACEKYGKPEFCCSGEYGTPDKCKPSVYSVVFKNACPTAYSYAYDDRTSTFTCGGGGTDYTITFCPKPSTSQKAASSSSGVDGTSSSSNEGSPSTADITGSSMVYMGALDATSSGVRISSGSYKWTDVMRRLLVGGEDIKNNKLPVGIGFLVVIAAGPWWWWLLLCHHFQF